MNDPIRKGDDQPKPKVMVSAVDLTKSFDNDQIRVLQGASLSVARGEVVALWGASGSGKSTLLHMLGGLDTPDSGSVEVDGLNPASERDRLRLRREKVGFVFQMHNLIPDLTLAENCLVTVVATRGSVADYLKRFQTLSELLGLEGRVNRRIQELSGGERQRVAICRALMHRPTVILADEPTGSLDEQTGETVFKLLLDTARNQGVTVVMASHERRFAERCDRIYQVRNGKATLV
jgi:ABC-type lipoprotein export system ATPase subunit